MSTELYKQDILGIDVELANVCNLKCPLCLSQLIPGFIRKSEKPIFLDVSYLIGELE